MKLRVKARGSAMVQDLEALNAGMRRYIGRRLEQGEVYKNIDGDECRTPAFVPNAEPQELMPRAEYVRAVKDGDLWAADEATAKYCGVTFDPDFGEPKAKKSDSK